MTYESYTTVVQLLTCIGKVLEIEQLDSLKASAFCSIMADESTYRASHDELSICALQLHNKLVEYFLGIVHAKVTIAKVITVYIILFCIPMMSLLRICMVFGLVLMFSDIV